MTRRSSCARSTANSMLSVKNAPTSPVRSTSSARISVSSVLATMDAFDARTGNVLYGPPPRPLDPIKLEVRANGKSGPLAEEASTGEAFDHDSKYAGLNAIKLNRDLIDQSQSREQGRTSRRARRGSFCS